MAKIETGTGRSAAERLEAWRRRGATVSVGGRRLFVVDEGSRDGETLLVLHGFPSCSYDFHAVLRRLAGAGRVVVHDHPGFGLSEKRPHDRYSLHDQADAALAVWSALGVTSGHLVAHDYGTSVATELLARRGEAKLPIRLHSVTLSNGSIYLEMAKLLRTQRLLRHPRIGPIFARVTSRRFFKARMRRLWGDPVSVDSGDLDVLWAALVREGGRAVLPRLSRYLDERVQFRSRWVGGLQTLDLPALVLWGREDPIAVPAIAARLAEDLPRASLRWLEGVGHYPMLEAPDAWSGALVDFVADPGAAALQAPEPPR